MRKIRNLLRESIALLTISAALCCNEATHPKKEYLSGTITHVTAYPLHVQEGGDATNKKPTIHTFYAVTLRREEREKNEETETYEETETCWYAGFEPVSRGSAVVYQKVPLNSSGNLGAIIPLAEGYTCRLLDQPPLKLSCAYNELHILKKPKSDKEERKTIPELLEKLLAHQ